LAFKLENLDFAVDGMVVVVVVVVVGGVVFEVVVVVNVVVEVVVVDVVDVVVFVDVVVVVVVVDVVVVVMVVVFSVPVDAPLNGFVFGVSPLPNEVSGPQHTFGRFLSNPHCFLINLFFASSSPDFT